MPVVPHNLDALGPPTPLTWIKTLFNHVKASKKVNARLRSNDTYSCACLCFNRRRCLPYKRGSVVTQCLASDPPKMFSLVPLIFDLLKKKPQSSNPIDNVTHLVSQSKYTSVFLLLSILLGKWSKPTTLYVKLLQYFQSQILVCGHHQILVTNKGKIECLYYMSHNSYNTLELLLYMSHKSFITIQRTK